LNETTFRLLKDHIRENFHTVDGASLADGRYVFKVVASDALDNPPGFALSGERISEPVDIDNTRRLSGRHPRPRSQASASG